MQRKNKTAGIHKKEIIKLVEELFLRKGYLHTNLRTIAMELQIEQAVITSYFCSTEDILQCIIVDLYIECIALDSFYKDQTNSREHITAAYLQSSIHYIKRMKWLFDIFTNGKMSMLSVYHLKYLSRILKIHFRIFSSLFQNEIIVEGRQVKDRYDHFIKSIIDGQIQK